MYQYDGITAGDTGRYLLIVMDDSAISKPDSILRITSDFTVYTSAA